MEPSGLDYVLERLNEVLAQGDRRPSKEEQREFAVTSFRRALNETEIYYGTRRERNERDRDKEEQLSRMWTDVAREMEPIDRELSRRCEIKGRYWADPIGWSPEKLMELEITLQEMRDSLDKLLDKKDKD